MQVSQAFAAKDVYLAALLGALLGYLGFVGLVALSVAVGSGEVGEIINVFIMGLFVGGVPAVIGSALIIAPVAVFIALYALGWLPQSRWHGMVTGIATATLITIVLALVADGEWREATDLGTALFLLGALIVAGIAGGLAQRRFLRSRARDQA